MIELPKNGKYLSIMGRDEEILKEIFPTSKFYVCGGRALSYHLNQSPPSQDIDLFFTSQTEYDNSTEELMKYVAKNFTPNSGNRKLDSPYAVTYFLVTGNYTFVIQLIKKIYLDINDIFKNFDMNHCTAGNFFAGRFVSAFYGKNFYQAIRKKEIQINNMHPKILDRVWKATRLGFVLSEDSVTKLMECELPYDFSSTSDGDYASI